MYDVPGPVIDAAHRWLAVHGELAPGLVEGLYLVGSAALGDWRPGSDVDVVAFTADPATDDDADRLRQAHEMASAELAAAALPAIVEGPRLAWADVTVPPQPVHRPWSLDGEFHHDADCFELNPVTWYTLAEHGVAVRGDPPDELGVVLDIDDRSAFVRGNTDTYWRAVAGQLAAALDDPARAELPGEVVEWCALGPLRMLFTLRTGGVTSKTGAGEWGRELLPDHAEVIDLALAARLADDPAPLGRDAIASLHRLVTEAVALVTGTVN